MTAPATPGAISGSTSICSGSSNTYSIATVINAISYTWMLPSGWIGNSTTNIITTTASATNGSITIIANNACGSSSSQTLAITVNSVPITPGTISGLTTLCLGSSNSFSVASVAGASSYTWSLPGAWTGTSTTNVISATTGTASGNISVSAVNACGTSASQTLAITVNPNPTITVNSGSICSGSSFTMVAGGANTYTYSSGPVVSPTVTSSYSVTGTSTAGCVGSNTAVSNVIVNPTPTINAVTSSSLICTQPTQQTATLTASGASTYTWNPGGAGTSIAVSPSVTTTYTVTGTNSSGCMNSSVITQSVSTCAGIIQLSTIGSEINVYPNPFSSKITIVSNGTKQAVQIFNMLGSLIYNTIIETEKTEIDLTGQASGIYFVHLTNSQSSIIKKIIKQ